MAACFFPETVFSLAGAAYSHQQSESRRERGGAEAEEEEGGDKDGGWTAAFFSWPFFFPFKTRKFPRARVHVPTCPFHWSVHCTAAARLFS